MPATELRPLSFGELLDRSFTYYRKHFWLFAGIMAPPQLFLLAAQLSSSAMEQGKENPSQGLLFAVFFYFPSFLLFLLTYMTAYGATAFAVSEIHKGQVVTIRQAYRKAWASLGRLMDVTLTIGLRAFLCAITIVLLPVAVLMIFWYALAIPALVLETITASQALKRSRFLTKGQLDRIFAIGVLMAIVSWAVVMVLQGPFLLASGVLSSQGAAVPLWLSLLGHTGGALAGIVTAPLGTIALVLLYYDIRVRKEGYDLQLMLEALPETARPAQALAWPAGESLELKKASVLVVLVLIFITGGIYNPVWYLTRRRAINSLQSSDKLSTWPLVFVLVCQVTAIVVAAFLGAAGNRPQEVRELVPNLLILAGAIVLIVQAFKVKGILADHFSPRLSGPFSTTMETQAGIQFSGVLTFFLQILYLQYKINRLLEVTPAADEASTAAAGGS